MSGTVLRQRLEWHKQSRGSLINSVKAQRHDVKKVKIALEENYRVVYGIYHPVTYKERGQPLLATAETFIPALVDLFYLLS